MMNWLLMFECPSETQGIFFLRRETKLCCFKEKNERPKSQSGAKVKTARKFLFLMNPLGTCLHSFQVLKRLTRKEVEKLSGEGTVKEEIRG